MSLLLISGCVGAGKFKALQEDKATAEKNWAEEKSALSNDKQKLSDQNANVAEQLTRQNILLSELLNDKMELEKEVASLKDRISNLSSESKSVEANLNEELARKNENLKLKEAKLNQMINWLLQQEGKLNQISAALGQAMTGYGQEEIEWLFENSRLDIILYQDFMFSSAKGLSSKGLAALDKLSDILAENASLEIFVEGHTNNSFNSAASAIEASTERAVVVGSYLLEAGDINGNQMTICGRGSYFPRVSNQTPAGRALNNRVEISLRPPLSQMLSFLE
ncbi:MAG: OmpA family protein [Saprospiraceae bacterium]|nr:OmpA family protein [Saprospiraceae bacterium]